MDINTDRILAIIGLILTIIFGFLGVDLFKRKKYPGKITLIKQSTISLFNTITKNFDEITIEYKNEPIKENVIYLKASLINDGDIDIDKGTIERPITLELKDELKWIKAKITNTSEGLICDNRILDDRKSLEFLFKLFRKNEFIQFEALIETSSSKYKAADIFEYFTIFHRIANTQNIKQTANTTEYDIKRSKAMLVIYKRILIVIIIFFITIPMVDHLLKFKSRHINYIDSNGAEYQSTFIYDSTITLKNIYTNNRITTSINDLQNYKKFKPIIHENSLFETYKNLLIEFLYIPVALIILILEYYYKLRKSNNLHNILNSSKSNASDKQ